MLIKLTDRIYYMPHNEETDRPILGYIKGDNYSLMVDAGNSKQHVEIFLDEISKLGLPHPVYVILTHSHWDHTYGLSGLNAVSIACRETNDHLEKMSKWEWTDEAMKDRLINGEDIEFCDTMIKREYENRDEILVKTADIVFENGLSIYLGNISCELRKIESSHADDCVVAYIPQEKVIFIGDIICEDLHHGEPVYYRNKLKSLIENMKAIDFETALFGHLQPLTKQEVIAMLEDESNIVI
ncbi:glyoxylase-like metal-dependent hydrolase (beta-lactamase superfamily II) [Sedimentibacter acidaminivorans]|uniref:Glyoxylase-like metal-dependent hydrolase (Beta-lactamase superfamily II) n=1 Tax=Sedimentibacter acidaminivorans TaxID=913099 RepID=A0ABS4GHX1_9FIRM|nr:MBL fold metallo-hydrolase [Sedimentibacter acidaminivorans]MBP1927132.1 glyoxylase-like metal-dependent hydrolase (beta-lactamase superfamily II) [Sedimentibacter acidaminivorans]